MALHHAPDVLHALLWWSITVVGIPAMSLSWYLLSSGASEIFVGMFGFLLNKGQVLFKTHAFIMRAAFDCHYSLLSGLA